MSALGNDVAQRWKYNGKEYSEDLGLNLYEYGARFYNPAIAQFTSIDPKAESFNFQAPYAYAANNPIYFEEKNGESPQAANCCPDNSLGYAYKYYGRKGYEKQLRAKKTEAAGTLIGVAAWVAPALISHFGWRATGIFVANEAKDEVASQVTGGLSDFVDLSKLAAKGIKAGIKKIKSHLSNPDLKLDHDVANDVMLDDLEKIAKGEMEPTDVHNDYFNHEIRESEHVANGLSYPEAHAQTLKDQNIDPLTSEGRLYTEEATRKGNEALEKEVNDELRNRN